MVCLGFEPGAAGLVGIDESTELWRRPSKFSSLNYTLRSKLLYTWIWKKQKAKQNAAKIDFCVKRQFFVFHKTKQKCCEVVAMKCIATNENFRPCVIRTKH